MQLQLTRHCMDINSSNLRSGSAHKLLKAGVFAYVTDKGGVQLFTLETALKNTPDPNQIVFQ